MGMYTQLSIGVSFRKDAPQALIDTISYMANPDPKKEAREVGAYLPKSDLYKSGRWPWMFRGGSYYFDAQPVLHWGLDPIDGEWKLTLTADIKNYGGEWEAFLAMICPHLETKGYIGTYWYEEWEKPWFVFCEGGKPVFKVAQELKEIS